MLKNKIFWFGFIAAIALVWLMKKEVIKLPSATAGAAGNGNTSGTQTGSTGSNAASGNTSNTTA